MVRNDGCQGSNRSMNSTATRKGLTFRGMEKNDFCFSSEVGNDIWKYIVDSEEMRDSKHKGVTKNKGSKPQGRYRVAVCPRRNAYPIGLHIPTGDISS